MNKIIECVPNISEGRNPEIINEIANAIKGTKGIIFLDQTSDYDHNRSVFTFIGDEEALSESVIKLFEKSISLIDLTKHQGEHPRLGAVDVVPFVPIKNVTMNDCVELAKKVGKKINEKFNLPVYLYEYAASAPYRKNLADIRRGEFEGLKEKMLDSMWMPDFGQSTPHPTAGVSVIGARQILIAYNINLNTDNLEIAKKIAKAIRGSSGGLVYVKALGVMLNEKNIAQVSMNLVDYEKTPVYRVFELVKIEAQRYGVQIISSEIIGLIPQKALFETAAYYLGIENWAPELVLENKIN